MDIEKFRGELERVLVEELELKAEDFSIHEMKALDLGIHPWHGYLELSFWTTEDLVGCTQIGDWILYNFSDAAGAKWPAAQGIAEWMRRYYDSNPLDGSAQLFSAAAAALNSSTVQAALQTYRRSSDFFVSVYNPDDSTYSNFCAQPSAPADAERRR